MPTLDLTIAVPYFGDVLKFLPLLTNWFESYSAAGLDPHNVVLVSEQDVEKYADRFDCRSVRVDLTGWRDLVRADQPFDLKGAVVCSYLLRAEGNQLVLDADAFVRRDPRPMLSEFSAAPIAMPADHGALLYYRTPRLDAPYARVRKLCAGVQYFAAGNRSRLVAGYRRAWQELDSFSVAPWTPPLTHLREQYAWSICAARRGYSVLPVTMNWAPTHLGDNPAAVIDHHFGFPKWSKLPAA